jgi:hypothetical protein
MGESRPQSILPIKLEKSLERLTSWGGLVVVEEMARGLKVWEKVDEVLEGPKSGRGSEAPELVQPLVWRLHAGGGGGDAARETLSAGGEAGAARARLGAANQSRPGEVAFIGIGSGGGVDRSEEAERAETEWRARSVAGR